MSELTSAFEAAAASAKNLGSRPDNATLLQLYALYKQSTQGDVSGKKPGMFDPVGAAKFDAWAKLKGTTSQAAMQQYIDLVNKLQGK